MSDEHKIKPFASDDNLKALGELLSNETSRKIMSHLMNNEMYTNEIATKLDFRVSLVIHHLKKMDSLGLVEITEKKIKRKGEKHRFFKIDSDIFVTLNKTKDEVEEKGILKRIFRDGIKFASIGIATVATWIGTQQKTIWVPDPANTEQNYGGIIVDSSLPILLDVPFSSVQITVTSIVLAVGLFLVWNLKKEKKEE